MDTPAPIVAAHRADVPPNASGRRWWRAVRSTKGRRGARRGFWRLGVAGALVALAVLPSSSSDARPQRLRFSSLDEAVAAGVIAPSLVADARTHGSVRVMASLDDRGTALALASATAVGTAAHGSAGTRIDGATLRSALDLTKAAVVDEAGAALHDRRDFANLPVIAATVHSGAELLALANATDIGSVVPDRVRSATLTSSLPSIGQPAATAAGFNGDGTYVAILDTGADYTRPAFGPCTSPGTPADTCRIAQLPADFTAGYDDGQPDDLCANLHGTNVSGIVAGVAPRTKLIVADVFRPIDPNAGCGSAQGAYDSDIAAAIDYVVAQKLAGINVVAINMSFAGGEHATAHCTDDMQIAYLRSVGIVPVAAAGNAALSGVTSGTFLGDGVASPACIDGALAVGATSDDGSMAAFSQSAPLPWMIFAPGVSITAAGITKSGTSMAAPHVAAALAIVAGAHPAWTPEERVQLLLDTASPTPNAYVDRDERRLSMSSWPRLLPRPANDDRANAALITGPTFAAEAYSATVEPGEGDHGGVAPSRTVWFRYVLGTNGAVEVSSTSNVGVFIAAGGGTTSPCAVRPSATCRRYLGYAGDVIDIAFSNPPGPLHEATGTIELFDEDPPTTTTSVSRGPVSATSGRPAGARSGAPSAVRTV